MRKSINSFLGLLLLVEPLISGEFSSDYDYLVNRAYTDHVQHFRKLFDVMEVESFLEFGIGEGTSYFLKHCKEVTSVEIILPHQTREWFDKSVNALGPQEHWHPQLLHSSDYFETADQIASGQGKDPALYDSTYRLELKHFCDEIFKKKAFDVVFVDPGFHMRGDLVNELFDRAPLIVAHDTNGGHLQFGWNKIHTPSNYQKIVLKEGIGVTLWIRDDYQHLLPALNQPLPKERKHLRIFFPQVHNILIKSMALTMQYLGHTLVLPGESFGRGKETGGSKFPIGPLFKKNALETSEFTNSFSKNNPNYYSFLEKNIEVIEYEEILTNPPDVIFVNCLEVEKSVYALLRQIGRRSKKNPKLVHYSGNNNSSFASNRVKNLIAVDAFTANLFDSSRVNILFWIPWIDYTTLTFEGVCNAPILNKYTRHYDPVFKNSAKCYQTIIDQAQRDFPDVLFASYPESFESSEKIYSLINESCATIHIKESEGFGYTILESLSRGRPVFLKRSFSTGSRLMNWCIEGKTAFFFDDYEEFQSKLNTYLEDSSFREEMQTHCAEITRKLINNEQQARILDQFLQNLN